MDRVFADSLGDLCRCLVVDAEGCNHLIKRIVHGNLDAESTRKVQSLHFFSQLRYEQFPLEWPRVPLNMTRIGNEPIFCVTGPAHSMKNSAGQLQSHIRTLYFGDIFADCSGALPHGLPWPAFQRRDAMSDRLCALLCGPQFLISPVVTGFALGWFSCSIAVP